MKNFLAVIGVLALLCLVVVIVGMLVFLGEPSVPDKTILEINFEQGIAEVVPDDPVAQVLYGGKLRMRDIIDGLEAAADDDHVEALVAYVGSLPMGYADIQEVRDAVMKFRESGKPAYIFAETFGEWSNGTKAYYLATAFDKIFLQPSGDVSITGIISSTPFLRGALDKLDIKPRVDQRYEYKNYANIFTQKDFTAAHREATTHILEMVYNQVVRDIAKARRMNDSQVKNIIDRAPIMGREALDAGLVDFVVYRDEMMTELKKQIENDDAELLFLKSYVDRIDRPHSDGPVVALIYAVGDVARGESGYDPIFSSLKMGAETVARAFKDAIEDDDVKAILLRIDSPGGSYVASDVIWREVVRAHEAGKPVIVSMSDVAGSGGYFIAMAADKIVAEPGTVTASIGVFGGKPITSGFWKKLGINWGEIHFGENAPIWSFTEDYSDSEWQRAQAELDRIYEDFTSKVAQGRRIPIDSVQQIARGRVWTGEDALKLGLVDKLGGFSTAIGLVKDAIGLAEDKDIELKQFPEEKDLLGALLSDINNSRGKEVNSVNLELLRKMQVIGQTLKEAGLAQNPGVLHLTENPLE